MTEQPPEAPDPAAVFLHIQTRLRDCRIMNEKMPAAEASASFAQLFQACQQLIATNERLRTAISISDSIVEELEIEIFTKDLEIFNFTTQQDAKDNK